MLEQNIFKTQGGDMIYLSLMALYTTSNIPTSNVIGVMMS